MYKKYGEQIDQYKEMIEKAEKEQQYWARNGSSVLWLPIVIPQKISMLETISDIYKKYISLLEDCGYNTISVMVHSICEDIISVLKEYLNGDVINAYHHFAKMMDVKLNDIPTKKVETGIAFYRMRTELDIIEEKEFYHLPANMRSKCSSARFSIAGYPCLYIGYSKKDCLVEISKTGSMIALALKDKEKDKMEVMDLTFFNDQSEGNKLDVYLKAWPLLAACYVIFHNNIDSDSAKFREEYIIPQMLTAYLRNRGKYKGICYYSVRKEDLNPLEKGVNDYRNIVLFPDFKEGKEYDEDLISKFIWYEPFNV